MVNSDELVPARRPISSGLFWAVISWSIPWCDIITCSNFNSASSARPCQPATPHAICSDGSGADVRVSATFSSSLSSELSLLFQTSNGQHTCLSEHPKRETVGEACRLFEPISDNILRHFCQLLDGQPNSAGKTVRKESEKGQPRGAIQHPCPGIHSRA
ncbi:hypothetical protein BJY00DRAFT_48375 [Aspergillus carlsbadensis]|nr:hypothetical protein BJY00DRAFT_48375 [Aspergillus carlsbadensis]